MTNNDQLSLAGQTLRWKFDSGPTGDATYEHTFNADGTVVYHQVEGDGAPKKDADAKKETAKPEKKKPTKYASFEVADGMHLMSYLSDNGYTLTVHIDVRKERVHGFASNDKEWFPLAGTLEP